MLRSIWLQHENGSARRATYYDLTVHGRDVTASFFCVSASELELRSRKIAQKIGADAELFNLSVGVCDKKIFLTLPPPARAQSPPGAPPPHLRRGRPTPDKACLPAKFSFNIEEFGLSTVDVETNADEGPLSCRPSSSTHTATRDNLRNRDLTCSPRHVTTGSRPRRHLHQRRREPSRAERQAAIGMDVFMKNL
ncbi:hypothetical protein EVAR_95004_1 [Eumeta japonica]|uniref:Uncharacterized protein n=1 Tax=Eumeta variegata TaxID=151549 RepID=A0A4C1UV36_EUMVA|nr:hypothetical protein EVAR_95004_1 [Eumeta japonica]